ncbi:Uma2 family endonuclease [Streptomyces sp. CAU 1734]|uniref:Uma2 family endonuclease n=1 Tax=Streptomyces sp. CAU 1734 TaxID=3140360 RepID=UPI0032606A41
MRTARDDMPDGRPIWARPPAGGWTADDLDTLPDLPPHTELIDGVLVFRNPQVVFHMITVRLMEHGLLGSAPEELLVLREMTVNPATRDRPEPDVMVARRSGVTSARQTSLEPEDILLAIEVVSGESDERDREVEARTYARAGIPHFWRVEENGGLPVVHVHELDPATHAHVVTGIHHGRLEVDVPFPISIELKGL